MPIPPCLSRNLSHHLRSHVDGITIGFANEVRAAPALEAVSSAVTYGSKDRRKLAKAATKKRQRYDSTPVLKLSPSATPTNTRSTEMPTSSNNNATCNHEIDQLRSNITVITLSPQDFIGLDLAGEADAAQGLMQSLTRIEWNGNGDYMSFASRSHLQWKDYHRFDEEVSHVPDAEQVGDSSSTLLVFVFLIAVVAYVVDCYGVEAESLLVWILRRILA